MKITSPINCMSFDIKHSQTDDIDTMYAISIHDNKKDIEADVHKLCKNKHSSTRTCAVTRKQYFNILQPVFAEIASHNRELLANSINLTKDPNDGYWYTDSRRHRICKIESGRGYILQVHKQIWSGEFKYIDICCRQSLKAARFIIVKRCIIPNSEILAGV